MAKREIITIKYAVLSELLGTHLKGIVIDEALKMGDIDIVNNDEKTVVGKITLQGKKV